MKVCTDGRVLVLSAHYDLHVQKQNAGPEDSTKPLFRYVRKQGPHHNLNLEAFTTHQLCGRKHKGRRNMEEASLILANRFLSAVPTQPTKDCLDVQSVLRFEATGLLLDGLYMGQALAQDDYPQRDESVLLQGPYLMHDEPGQG